MNAREQMLGRIRVAVGSGFEPPAVPRDYAPPDRGQAGPLVELFCKRVADYRANIARVDVGDIVDAISNACTTRATHRVVCAPGVDWTVRGVELIPDSPEVDPATLDVPDVAALTGCAVAIAGTGTVVLDGGPLSGRRALTLVPDHHICVVFEEQIVAGVPDGIAALAGAARDGRPLTLISGPSATSDIELERVEGVHGPRKLDVIVARK